jgi:hypothetical protein
MMVDPQTRSEYRGQRLAAAAVGVKSLIAANKEQSRQLATLNDAVGALGKSLDPNFCGCGGTCAVCNLDRVKPLVDTIFRTSNRAAALTKRLEGYGIKSLGGFAYGPAGELVRELEAARAECRSAWNQLCGPGGIDPDNDVCKQGCPV